MLYRRWACKEASSVPLRSRYVPWPPDRQWAGWVSRSTIGRVGYCWRSRHLIEGWLSCSPPLTSLPPHVSRPGWYPAPLGSYSRQLRHTLKHGMDTEELTSHENKRLCAEPAGQDEGPAREGSDSTVLKIPHLRNTPGGYGPSHQPQAGILGAATPGMAMIYDMSSTQKHQKTVNTQGLACAQNEKTMACLMQSKPWVKWPLQILSASTTQTSPHGG